MPSVVAGPAPGGRAASWQRFVARALVLLWGAIPLYFVAAASLGGITEPGEALARLVQVVGVGGLLLLGLLLAVWRRERVAVRLLVGLAALAAAFSAQSLLGVPAAIGSGAPFLALLLNVLLTVVGGVLPPLVSAQLLLASVRQPPAASSSGRLDAFALRAGLVLLGLTLIGLLVLVLGNLPFVQDGWLLWVNYAFLVLLAGVLGWQFREAWSATRHGLRRAA
jgi:hypothetical protein